MSLTVRSKIVKVGNSRGIRIPRTLLEQAGLIDEVEMSVEGNKLIIHPARTPRQSWSEQFASMAENLDDRLLDDVTSAEWDENEWEW
jgi:antitoxin MazE